MSIEIIISIVLGLAAGAMKAMRDTIAHHWTKSTFNMIINDDIWSWFYSDWREKYKYPFWKFYVFLIDGWHFGDFFSYFLLFIGVYFEMNAIAMIISFYLSFNVCYEKVFVINIDNSN